MRLKKLGLEVIDEVVNKNSKNEQSKIYKGLTQGREDREAMFLILFDEYIEVSLGKVFAQLKRWIILNRELNIDYILGEIHKAEACNDIEKLSNIIGETFLEDIDIHELNELKAKMHRQGWTWETLLDAYAGKQDQRVNRFLNIPYLKYSQVYVANNTLIA